MEKEITCIICPQSCLISVIRKKDNLVFSGHKCLRGPKYVTKELINPERMVTTTIAIESAIVGRLSVVSSKAVPKEYVFDCVNALKYLKVKAPIKVGDVVYSNILGLDIDIIATKTLEKIN